MGAGSDIGFPRFLLRVADGKHGAVVVGLISVQIVDIREYVLSAVKADTGRRHQHRVLVTIAVNDLIAEADGRVMLVIEQTAHLPAIKVLIMRILGEHQNRLTSFPFSRSSRKTGKRKEGTPLASVVSSKY